MTAKEISNITGISVRTLHHYDSIGLLVPERNPENDYRIYSRKHLERLQQILFFRECGFSLSKISQIINSDNFDLEQAFILQKKYLTHEKRRIEMMLKTLNKSISNLKGECKMTEKEMFKGFDFSKNPYEKEARKRWGDNAVDKGYAYLSKMTQEEKEALGQKMNDLFFSLSELRFEDPAGATAQAAIGKMYCYFNENFGAYSLEAFAGVGQMYIQDERFKKNIDAFGEGLSAFLAKAMGIYAESTAGKANPG